MVLRSRVAVDWRVLANPSVAEDMGTLKAHAPRVATVEGSRNRQASISARYQPLLVLLVFVASGIVLARTLSIPAEAWWLLALAAWVAWFVFERRDRPRAGCVCLLSCGLALEVPGNTPGGIGLPATIWARSLHSNRSLSACRGGAESPRPRGCSGV